MGRKLTKNEEKRKEIFDKKCQEMIDMGYEKKELMLDINEVNSRAIKLMIPTVLLILIPFYLLNKNNSDLFVLNTKIIYMILIYFLLIVIHELIHGIFFAMFSKNGFKDIAFGAVWKHLTVYCSCISPVFLKEYVISALMPLVILGIIPAIHSFITGSFLTLFVGVTMVVGAFGDILIVENILKNIDKEKEILILDHPTEIGSVAFERKK
ncbi:DUF3267 domain-containing protein [Streptobacillus felis]|uniref:DUF3267 domain-containing protein n=1 Tax=Streptobacillus felis TaxID=1384509 RepID=UPI00083779E8|nr:DUF3267 domain-containing protein [Streptobacillus felis]